MVKSSQWITHGCQFSKDVIPIQPSGTVDWVKIKHYAHRKIRDSFQDHPRLTPLTFQQNSLNANLTSLLQ